MTINILLNMPQKSSQKQGHISHSQKHTYTYISRLICSAIFTNLFYYLKSSQIYAHLPPSPHGDDDQFCLVFLPFKNVFVCAFFIDFYKHSIHFFMINIFIILFCVSKIYFIPSRLEGIVAPFLLPADSDGRAKLYLKTTKNIQLTMSPKIITTKTGSPP